MQSQVLTIARALSERGHRVTVAVGGGDLAAPDGVDVVSLPKFSPVTFFSFVRALRHLRREVRADVVHGHGLRLAPALRVVGSAQRFVTCHGLDPEIARRAARLARWSAVPVISCGRGPFELLQSLGVTSHILNNAFSPSATSHSAQQLRREFDLVDEVPVVVYPARYSRQKSHDRLLDALALVRAQLAEKSPEVLCFGAGPLEDEVRARAQNVEGRPLARVMHYRDDAATWFAGSDFFILPSRWEGQPLVVLEALAQGLSVVTLTPGVEDLIVEGRNGSSAHSVEQLAKIIVQWCQHPESRPHDDDVTRSVLVEHSLDVVASQYEELYGVVAHPRT